jgi:hypothetical protein
MMNQNLKAEFRRKRKGGGEGNAVPLSSALSTSKPPLALRRAGVALLPATMLPRFALAAMTTGCVGSAVHDDHVRFKNSCSCQIHQNVSKMEHLA